MSIDPKNRFSGKFSQALDEELERFAGNQDYLLSGVDQIVTDAAGDRFSSIIFSEEFERAAERELRRLITGNGLDYKTTRKVIGKQVHYVASSIRLTLHCDETRGVHISAFNDRAPEFSDNDSEQYIDSICEEVTLLDEIYSHDFDEFTLGSSRRFLADLKEGVRHLEKGIKELESEIED